MDKKRMWMARILIAAVFFVNVQCAVQFIAWPESYTAAYQLEGASALSVVRSFGICFLMWNATYPPVIARPERYRMLFTVVIAQQAIGLIGETLLVIGMTPELAVMAASVWRFIAFDGAGLVLLAIAFAISRGGNATRHTR